MTNMSFSNIIISRSSIRPDKIEIHAIMTMTHRDKYHLSLKLDLQCPSNMKEKTVNNWGIVAGWNCHGVNEQRRVKNHLGLEKLGGNEQMTFSVHAHCTHKHGLYSEDNCQKYQCN